MFRVSATQATIDFATFSVSSQLEFLLQVKQTSSYATKWYRETHQINNPGLIIHAIELPACEGLGDGGGVV